MPEHAVQVVGGWRPFWASVATCFCFGHVRFLFLAGNLRRRAHVATWYDVSNRRDRCRAYIFTIYTQGEWLGASLAQVHDKSGVTDVQQYACPDTRSAHYDGGKASEECTTLKQGKGAHREHIAQFSCNLKHFVALCAHFCVFKMMNYVKKFIIL